MEASEIYIFLQKCCYRSLPFWIRRIFQKYHIHHKDNLIFMLYITILPVSNQIRQHLLHGAASIMLKEVREKSLLMTLNHVKTLNIVITNHHRRPFMSAVLITRTVYSYTIFEHFDILKPHIYYDQEIYIAEVIF